MTEPVDEKLCPKMNIRGKLRWMKNEGLNVMNSMVSTFQRLSFSKYVIKKVIEGYRFRFMIADLCAKEWYDDERNSTPETAFIKERILEKGDRVADCGGHHGLVTLLASKVVGENGQVYAFEALPKNAEIIEANAKLNGLENVVVKNVAVGEKNSLIDFTNDSNGFVAKDDTTQSTIKVEMVSLDEFFDGKKNPNFLKIDVEGHEIEVLKGAQRILQTKPHFAVEFHCVCHADPVAAINEFMSFWERNSYDIFVQEVIDGPIERLDDEKHPAEHLATHDNIHFFGVCKKGAR